MPGQNNITSSGSDSGSMLTGTFALPVGSVTGAWNVSVNQGGLFSNDNVQFIILAPPTPTVTPTVTPIVTPTVIPTPSEYYSFDVESDQIGWISPSGTFSTDPGSSLSFSFKPTAGAMVKNLTVNGLEVSPKPESSYTIENVDKDYMIRLNNEPLPGVVIAAFTAELDDGPTVTFTDVSWGSPRTWKWDFGNGTSASENPVTHTYAKAGTYQVSLWTRNDLSQSQVVVGDIVVPMTGEAGSLMFIGP